MKRNIVLAQSRLAGQVKRYHTWPVLHPQTNAEHTWQVLRIWYELYGPPPAVIFQHILWHDAGELVTGDPPFPFKAQNPEFKKAFDLAEKAAVLSMGGPKLGVGDEVSTRRVKLCDLIEMWEYGIHESMLGNKFAQPIIDDTWEQISQICAKLSPDEARGVERYMIGRQPHGS
jgi:5'-deoxynucleotidase YfbR-like HD superfamily hydrolase